MNYKIPLLLALFVSAPAFADTSCESAYKVSEGGVAYLQFGNAKSLELPEAGPGQQCEKIWAHPGSRYVVAEVKGGLLGTQVLVQHTYLLVYEVKNGALNEIKRIELQSTERSSKGTVTLKDCEARVPELGHQSKFMAKSMAKLEIQLKCQGSASVENIQIP